MSLEDIKHRSQKVARSNQAKRLIGEDIPKLIAALEAINELVESAYSGSSFVLPGGYPSRPVEAKAIRDAITEALA